MTLEELKARVLEDGVIDTEEVKLIRETLLDDGVIDREEADFLFTLNDAVTGKENSIAWPLLFANAITAHVLLDDESENSVDEAEANWLLEKINGDSQIDAAEKLLLENLKVCSSSIHESLLAIM